MNRNGFLFIPFFLISFLFGCKKDSQESTQTKNNYSLIIGDWALDKQHLIFSVNGSKTVDTTYVPGGGNHAEIQFGSDNSYMSLKYYPNGEGSITTGALTGMYGFSGSEFSMSNRGIFGLWNGDPTFEETVAVGTPTILTYYSIKITQLTTSNLDIQTVFQYTYDFGVHTFKAESDFYCSK